MAHYKGQWDEIGLVIFAFLDALKLSPWVAPRMYENWEDAAFNVLVGYYMTLANMMIKDEQFGNSFQHNSAQITIRNDITTCANFIVRYFHQDDNIPFMPSKTIEWSMEPHFGDCKKHVRGMCRFKDLINGREGQHHFVIFYIQFIAWMGWPNDWPRWPGIGGSRWMAVKMDGTSIGWGGVVLSLRGVGGTAFQHIPIISNSSHAPPSPDRGRMRQTRLD